jgi:tripartite-type tricarboxylate transporter receptor subunit TctC
MIELGRRAALGSLAASAATAALAAEWPSKTSTWVVPFPAGGPTDVFARLVATRVSAILGQPIVIDNRGGAGGTIGAAQVARVTPDGYTMLVGYTGHTFSPIIYPKAGFELGRDFAPISAFARVQSALVVNPAKLDVKTLQEFIEMAKAKPESIDVASPGLGTVPHLALVGFQSRTGVSLHHVPYRGGAPALQDLLAGVVAASFTSIATIMPQLREGKLRALAVAGRRREALLPDVPTMDEAGLKDFRAVSWYGLFAPKRVPTAILDRLQGAIQKALADDEIKRVWAEQAAKVELESRADFTRFVGQEIVRWSERARAAGVEIE